MGRWRKRGLLRFGIAALAAPLLAAWLGAQPRADGTGRNRLVPMLLCVFSPLAVMAVFGGHPEEVLGAALCVAGVVAAARDRPALAGVLIGLAVINKSWALVAVPVVLAVAPAHRGRMLLIIAALAGGVLVPVTLVRAGGAGAIASGAALGTGIGSIFNPPQLLWWFGPGSWVVAHAREGIVLASVICAGLWWARRGAPTESAPPRLPDALLLLALVLLLRAALDPWNSAYDNVPFLFAMLAYEVLSDRPPVLTVRHTVLFFLIVAPPPQRHRATVRNSPSGELCGGRVPLIGWIGLTLFGGRRAMSILSRSRASCAPAAPL